ncbi:MAG: insulinase family protein [Brevinematales bacterium]|nr:insulinase family protein [Brevinematales bacterium]
MAKDISDIQSIVESNRIDFRLPNGLEVVLLNVEGARSVNITLGFNAGSLYEDKPGVAYVTGQSILFKNKNYRMLEISEIIESLGGSINVSVNHDSSVISVKCLYEDIETVVPKLVDLVKGFEVDNQVLDILKPSIISGIRAKEDDPWDYTRKVFLKEIYGNHPYGREPEADEESIMSVTVNDVKSFYHNLYTPDNAILVFVGKVEKEKVRNLVEKMFGDWSSKRKLPKIPTVPQISARKEIKINKKLKQSTIRIGHISTSVTDKNRTELKILNFILGGGGFGSRLMEKVREKEGLAYGIFSNFYIDRKLNGYFFIGTQTESKNVLRTIQIITNEVEKIIKEGIEDKELEDTKNFARGSLLLGMESFSVIASFLISEKMFGLDRNYFLKEIEKISVIRKEDIHKVAREYIKPENFTIVIVGGE